MNLFTAMDISASAMTAQSLRMNAASSNLANTETTRTASGEPYYRKSVVLSPKNSFDDELASRLPEGVAGVEVAAIRQDQEALRDVYDPGHPDANGEGYVTMPDINVLEEMTDIMAATRAYEANVTSIKASQRMAVKALEIGG
ncbi:flagellar basal body rod protein FlgC [Desulfohalobium retbaense]|uniref:Flagellar basal-body rod protein FlgC n=1 Tax=Desulfohalobium retbaense (strain ATCC 49708 / DSM 5692 / JCM 16813 / HR100) TaxID=485915 RepID=C8X0J9_DESRD|nr:flagellar basal body rod protein FlgC [Desulfohalobium retbaense]ACV67946.1 flagellar basal-body rod protein FlgC [Desulfohalobium retbaense DSM 5692]